jgi:uncharacterized protein
MAWSNDIKSSTDSMPYTYRHELKQRSTANTMLSKELLEILACPKCKNKIEADDSNERLICRTCGLAFPIRDDIPVMLLDEATPLETE